MMQSPDVWVIIDSHRSWIEPGLKRKQHARTKGTHLSNACVPEHTQQKVFTLAVLVYPSTCVLTTPVPLTVFMYRRRHAV